MPDFLLELRSEEIPARMQARARADLERLLREQLAQAGLQPSAIQTYATPRRLALIARDLPEATAPTREERRGPRADAPAQALEGFLKSTGLSRDQLEEREDKKGVRVLFAVIERPGRPTADVLAEAVPAAVRAFPWPKSMRWGAASVSTESPRWVRPLRGIVALFGEDLVAIEVAGVEATAWTLGHRVHHPGPITLGGAHDYEAKLRACHVILDADERARIITDGARALAAEQGLQLIQDDALAAENAGLTEWPVPLLGRFDPAFLQVPREVIQLTMRTNQKYFSLTDGEGALAPAFICVANIDAPDGGQAITQGNERVLAARLSDARFFWEADLKVPLEEQAGKLSQIVFHEKLGTVADKVDRVARLARWLVDEGIVAADPDQAERAARLAKADLVTGTVGEFPEVQGIAGGHIALAQGEHPSVAAAIRDHYKPVGQGDEVPTDPVTVAVSLADKLDTIGSFFASGMPPSGSKDPFALRRSALGIVALILVNRLRLPLQRVLELSTMWLRSQGHDLSGFALSTADFFADRLKVQQREAGVRHDLIDAVFALGGEDDIVRLLARVHALQAFMGTEDGANLHIAYKRAANILKKEGWGEGEAPSPLVGEGGARAGAWEGEGREPTGSPQKTLSAADAAGPHPNPSPQGGGALPLSYTPDLVEHSLITALDSAETRARDAVQREEFEAAMSALASLRAPIDAFFEEVTVNDPDPAKRAGRLALLARFRDAVHAVADFSRIEG